MIFGLFINVSSVNFCQSQCPGTTCTGTAATDCPSCDSIFQFSGGVCAAIPYTNLNSSQYQPFSISSDIIHALSSSFSSISAVSITSSPTALPLSTCTLTFLFYGTYHFGDNLIIDSPAISDLLYFYKIKLRFWVFTKDGWDITSKIKTTFITNTTESPKVTSIGNISTDVYCSNLCGSASLP